MALDQGIESLTEKARSTRASLDDVSRTRALKAAQALVQTLTTPREIVTDDLGMRPVIPACALMGVQLGVFQTICNSEGGATTQEIADKSGASVMVAAGVQLFVPSLITKFMTDPAQEVATRFSELGNTCIGSAPESFRRNGHQFPPSFEDTPFQLGFNTKLSLCDWLGEIPSVAKEFHQFMAYQQASLPNWVDWFDVEGAILDGYDQGQPEITLIVDVRGGEGQQLHAFTLKFPPSTIRGRRIVQDRPNVIANIAQPASETGIQPMGHDFFTPQPVKGARVYYMHWIIHSWSDEQARAILTHVAEAMEPGYSRLVINDRIVPDTGCDFTTAALGVIMMFQCAAVERTEGHLRELLASVPGFKDFEFHHPPASAGGIIVVTK
ncbi:hypothetical protein BDW74DRAFT_172693 [Aspergillus multicolor]|uniref:uncharacterized protein n=1 Tax=Aspergillus multicolor TaxID=41759 RepID=UPI003CCDDBF4